MYSDKFFYNLKGIKWGYVSYHFSHCYINYCIRCNEKAAKKPKKSRAELRQHYSWIHGFVYVIIARGLHCLFRVGEGLLNICDSTEVLIGSHLSRTGVAKFVWIASTRQLHCLSQVWHGLLNICESIPQLGHHIGLMGTGITYLPTYILP
jgi:hypothetical protein